MNRTPASAPDSSAHLLMHFTDSLLVRQLFTIVWLMLWGTAGVSGAGVYPHLEGSFDITNLATDPFDYTLTDVRVQIVQPDNATVSLPAFYDGGTTWRVRHTPSLPGGYRVLAVTLNGQNLSVANLQPTSWLVSGAPWNHGFVAVDPANASRFVTGDGRRYYPLGQDAAWDTSSTTNVVGIMAKLGAAHENWSRVWMDPWDGKNLDWPRVGNFGTLSLTVALKWDAIVSAAEQNGVSFQMTLHHHGEYSSNVDPNWPQNPYNTANGGFLSDATQFFTNATAKALTKRKLRYAAARWGHSPAIMGWELFNEVQFTDAAQAGLWANIGAWHDEMAQFLRSQDIYHHLITTSSQLDEPIWGQCDYYQHHDYPADLISALRDAAGVPAGQPVKPIFGGECGMQGTPFFGFHGPLWAGLMGAQSGAAQQWYWDHIDADNAYSLFHAARDFVLLSGLADQDVLAKAAPHVTCPQSSSLVFSPGGGYSTASQDSFIVGDVAPDGIGTLPSFLQGNYHRAMTPNGFTFIVNYPPGGGTFSVQVLTIAQSGAGLLMTVDNTTTNSASWPASASDVSTNFTLSVNVSAGQHTVKLWDPGMDWVNLGNITLNPYVPVLGAYQIGNSNFAALWIWHRTNIYAANASATVSGTFPLAGLQPGNYAATWWDTFAGVPLSNFNFSVTGTNVVMLATPPILRSAAMYVGPPPLFGSSLPLVATTLATNSSPTNFALQFSNFGGLPAAYSLAVTGAAPVSYSSANSTQPGGPTFAWQDISAIGRNLTGTFTALGSKNAKDEGISGPIDIGFGFPFFSGGQASAVFTQLYLSPNGFVTFSSFAGDTSTNRALPNTLAPTNCIAFFWDDLDLSTGGNVYCATDSIAGTFTIQFQAAPIKGTGTSFTGQLILKTTGEIVMQYQALGVSNACTVGVQNANRDQGVTVAFNQNYLQSGLAVRLSPNPWLSLSANAGLIPRGATDTVNLGLDPIGLSPGRYTATVLIQNPQSGPPYPLPVSLNVLLPIDRWRLTQFGTSNNSGIAADNADPDHDGLVNLVEYALGLNPNSADPDPVSFSLNGNHLRLSYQRPHPAPADITYITEVTGSLGSANWNSGAGYVTQTVVDNGNGTERVTVTDLADATVAPAHYLRVRFTR
jgi:hypothetical protein